jgi:archaemetzincin
MKKIILFSVSIILILFIFSNYYFNKIKTVHIIPLGKVDKKIILHVEKSIADFYKIKCIIEKEVNIDSNLLADSKTRLEASKILSHFLSIENRLIITEKDIAVVNKERNSNEWGIFGLGYQPGATCVISTFRLKRNANQQLLYKRLQKVCIHEVGHNLGLTHCTSNNKCLMNDANGSIKQVDLEEIMFCKDCKEKIK